MRFDDSSFSGRLFHARTCADVTQAELASQANINLAQVSHYETGLRKPSFDALVRLSTAKCFVCLNLHWLITGKGDWVIPHLSKRQEALSDLAQADAAYL